jgi:hypothetical protein
MPRARNGHDARLLQTVALLLLLVLAVTAGMLDAAGNTGFIEKHVAALAIFACLLLMFACLGAASKDHRALLINTFLAGASVIIADLGLAFVFAR